MEEEHTNPAGGCPPHHWVIANTTSDQGLIERWSCRRCEANRERLIARRRLLPQAPKRYVGGAGEGPIEHITQSGERVV